LAKIAVKSEVQLTGPAAHRLASGEGWTVSDLVCTAGPSTRPFEEQHLQTSIAIVVSGTFQYRSPAGCELMTPGSWLLGNSGDRFTCGHEHGTGDRCVSFSYTPEFFECLASGAGGGPRFKVPRLPPIRALAPLVASVSSLLAGTDQGTCEELSIQLAAQALQAARGIRRPTGADASSLARVTRVVRMIDSDPDAPDDLRGLARIARLSPYHFLRTFEGLTGTTPHQYLLRVRLRRAAIRLRTEPAKVLDIALDCGFGDISNFNRAFRAEFGVSPRAYRLSS
jgi:AraC-like DNA-binding protein